MNINKLSLEEMEKISGGWERSQLTPEERDLYDRLYREWADGPEDGDVMDNPRRKRLRRYYNFLVWKYDCHHDTKVINGEKQV